MIDLPKFDESFTYENMFYLSCDSDRLEKILMQYEIFKKSIDIPGAIIECGVFKGASFSRYAMFRRIHSIEHKSMIGFDAFGEFPETSFIEDQELRKEFIELDGKEGIAVEQLREVLVQKQCANNIELIKGDICSTVPDYISKYADLEVSFINLDVDIYEPSKVILESLYPKLSVGGVLLLDNYGEFPGETKAVDDYLNNINISIQECTLNKPHYYVVKK